MTKLPEDQKRLTNKLLYLAAEQGNVKYTRKYITDGANVNYQHEDDETPLFIASLKGHTSVVRLLMKHMADPNISDKYGRTPFDVANADDVAKLLDSSEFYPKDDPDNDGRGKDGPFQLLEVHLVRQVSGFGFRIIGGREEGTQVTIGGIVQGGVADVDGRLKVGDELTAVNRMNVVNRSHEHVVKLITQSSQMGEVTLGIRRKMSWPVDTPFNTQEDNMGDIPHPGPREVIIQRPNVQTSFGFVIQSNTSRMGSMISRLIPGSPTEACGKLFLYDKLLIVNGHDVTRMDHGDVVQLIKCSDITIRLVVQQPETSSQPNKFLMVNIVKGPLGFGFSLTKGCIVKQIFDKARCAQLMEGDIIQWMNGEKVYPHSHSDLITLLKRCPKGSTTNFLVMRDSSTLTPSPSPPLHSTSAEGPATNEVSIELVGEVVTGAKGKMKVGCFLLHGAPCAGKTSTKRLLLGLPPLYRGNSTILMEDVVKAIRNIGTIKVMAVNDSCLELEVMDGKKTIQMIQREIRKFLRAKNEKTSDKKSKRNHPSSHHATNDTVHDHCPATPTTDHTHSLDEDKSSPPPITESPNPSCSELLHDIATDLDSLESTDGPTLFQCHHINIVDSGGQPQFSNLLPLVFLSQLHHHLVTIRLDQLLSDKPINCFNRDGTIHHLPEHLVLTNYQLIERVCQLAAGSQSHVIIIATRLDDQNTEEPLAKKNELLKPLVQKYADNIVLNEQGDPIFAVNAMAPVGEERKGYTRMLQEVILDAPVLTNTTEEDDIEVPLRWIVLEQELNRESEDVGVFEMTKTVSIANDLQVKNLTEALNFFKELALLYHYPVLPDKIFTSITPISLRLSEIVEATLVHKGGRYTNERKKLQKTGKLSKSFLKKLCSELPPNEFFSLNDFVSLMIHLRVFFEIDPNTIFIPSLLPVEISEPLGKDLHEPLLCYWMHNDEIRILPQSYFHALIVELLGRKETIKLNTMCNHSRSTIHLIVILPLHKEYRLVVVDCDFWFEVFIDICLECKHRQLVLELIQSCTVRVLEQLKLSRLGESQYGLRCYSPECSVEGVHPSKCVDRCLFRFKCLKSGEFWKEEERERHFWFKDNTGDVPTTAVSKYRKPKLSEVYQLLKGKSSHWSDIGREFDIPLDVRESLSNNLHYTSDLARLEMVLNEWLSTTDQSLVTWEEFIRVLSDRLKYMDIVHNTNTFLQTL